MKKIIRPIDMNGVSFDKTVYIDEKVKYFTDIQELNPIPSKRIIHKTITGIGATHSEIAANRNSIIVFPHISVVVSKHAHYQVTEYSGKKINTLAVYGEISTFQVGAYLETTVNSDENAKILTTPQGLYKVINAFYQIWPEYEIKEYFFLLIDECQKLIQDARYRSDMLKLMDEFFSFEHIAMVSATPIMPNDPRFAEYGFLNVKVQPSYDHKQTVELIHCNSLVNGLKTYFEENDNEHYLIFFDSIDGINDIIQNLNIESSAKLHCSQESYLRLTREGITYCSWKLDVEFPKYSFFTSSFFNGLDIEVSYKPNIVLLSDVGFGKHTVLDPYTDVLQIIGRVRRKKDDQSYPYNKITHMINSAHFSNPISQDNAVLNIYQSETVYNSITTLRHSLADHNLFPLFDQALQTVKPYYNLLNDGSFSYFLADNYLDDERVKGYYKNISALMTAYSRSKLFRTELKRYYVEKNELIHLRHDTKKNSRERIEIVADLLLALEEFKGLDIYFEQRVKIAQYSKLAYDGFDKLGYEMMQSLSFKKALIEKQLLQLAIEEGKNKFPVINLVYKIFNLNKFYPVEEIKPKLQKVFNEFDIEATAKATDVERYFDIKTAWKNISGSRTRGCIFIARKLNPVEVTK